jgi:hypothetical protein
MTTQGYGWIIGVIIVIIVIILFIALFAGVRGHMSIPNDKPCCQPCGIESIPIASNNGEEVTMTFVNRSTQPAQLMIQETTTGTVMTSGAVPAGQMAQIAMPDTPCTVLFAHDQASVTAANLNATALPATPHMTLNEMNAVTNVPGAIVGVPNASGDVVGASGDVVGATNSFQFTSIAIDNRTDNPINASLPVVGNIFQSPIAANSACGLSSADVALINNNLSIITNAPTVTVTSGSRSASVSAQDFFREDAELVIVVEDGSGSSDLTVTSQSASEVADSGMSANTCPALNLTI